VQIIRELVMASINKAQIGIAANRLPHESSTSFYFTKELAKKGQSPSPELNDRGAQASPKKYKNVTLSDLRHWFIPHHKKVGAEMRAYIKRVHYPRPPEPPRYAGLETDINRLLSRRLKFL
jgi:hypothetical protein